MVRIAISVALIAVGALGVGFGTRRSERCRHDQSDSNRKEVLGLLFEGAGFALIVAGAVLLPFRGTP